MSRLKGGPVMSSTSERLWGSAKLYRMNYLLLTVPVPLQFGHLTSLRPLSNPALRITVPLP